MRSAGGHPRRKSSQNRPCLPEGGRMLFGGGAPQSGANVGVPSPMMQPFDGRSNPGVTCSGIVMGPDLSLTKEGFL